MGVGEPSRPRERKNERGEGTVSGENERGREKYLNVYLIAFI
jgi:hypothetical protein